MLGTRFRRLAHRCGRDNEKKAAVAVARALLGITWAVMATGGTCTEQGEDFYERRAHRAREHIAARHQQTLAGWGPPSF